MTKIIFPKKTCSVSYVLDVRQCLDNFFLCAYDSDKENYYLKCNEDKHIVDKLIKMYDFGLKEGKDGGK